jgi:hypothetical protein
MLCNDGRIWTYPDWWCDADGYWFAFWPYTDDIFAAEQCPLDPDEESLGYAMSGGY